MDIDIAERARRELRRHYEGVLLFHGLVCPVRFIIDGGTGRLLMPVEPGAVEAGELTLLVPDERDDAAQALLVITPAEPRGDAGEGCDRWSVYHGGTERSAAGVSRTAWVWGAIEALKLDGGVCGGEEVGRPNPLRAIEPRLCRELNAQRDAVSGACRRETGLAVESPLVVGVDAEGIDVRARFGILRLEFERTVASEEDARAELRRLLGEGAGA